MKTLLLTIVFWAALIAFFGWDWAYSEPTNTYDAPAVLALGSGQAPSGAHCASTF